MLREFNITELFTNVFCDAEFLRYFSNPDENSQLRELVLGIAFNPTLIHFAMHFMLLGCPIKTREIFIEPDREFNLDLSEEIGNGRLLYINYTPNGIGGLFPVEIHGNIPMGHEYCLKKRLYPVNFQPNIKPNTTSVFVQYAYATEKHVNDISLLQFVEAFNNYSVKRYSEAVIKLQIVAEFTLNRFKEKYTTERRCKSRGGYEKILRKEFPKIIEEQGLTPCPSEILVALDEMRKVRNKIMHEGGIANVNDEEMKHWIVNTFFF